MNLSGLELLVRLVRSEVLTDYAINSDIITTRVLLDVLESLHMAEGAYAINAPVIAVNEVFAACMDIDGSGWPSRKLAQKWAKDSGAWTVGCGIPPHVSASSLKWDGHLVLIVPSKNLSEQRSILIDPSADQMARPDKKILTLPFCVETTEDFVEGKSFFGTSIRGSMLTYHPFPEDFRFIGTPAWNDDASRRPIVSRIVKKLAQSPPSPAIS